MKNEIILTIEEEESDAEVGSIIYQSRTAGSEVVKGATLTIKVAKAKSVTPQTNNSNSTNQEESNN